MRLDASDAEVRAILGAMRAVASSGDTELTETDRVTIAAAGHFLFAQADGLDVDALPAIDPTELAATVSDAALRQDALKLLAVTALVDGSLDRRKIERVSEYAAALDRHEQYVTELTEAAHGHLQWALGDMARQNLLSITGRRWDVDDNAAAWLLPYREQPDPALAQRYRALAGEPAGSLGRAFSDWYTGHGFAFPGEPDALNEQFATPHDSTHILSGYSTTPQGELLVSTFTASMHPEEPMSGHVLPVIISWHLGIEINPVAGSFRGALDPEKFWVAWARGAETAADVFSRDWDLWSVAATPVAELRERYGVPPLEDRYAASSDGTEGVDYHPIA